MLATELSLAWHGAQILAGLAAPVLDELGTIAARMPGDRAGTRIAGDAPTAALLRSDGVIGRALCALTGRDAWPVRAILFDKNDRANWALGWHQDRTIAVRERRELPGYGSWTIKHGLQHVEPPFDVIAGLITVRIHLDSVDSENAPLLIVLGSHRLGLIPEGQTEEVAAQGEIFACLAGAGDVWVYCTPVLHASRAVSPGRRRRVLQVDYAAERLPGGLEWLGL